jgi:hypothetical protein
VLDGVLATGLKVAVSKPAKAIDFKGGKNPQHSFL